MDNHPIPQDVTHFQFKLIGELTIKQFAYVAVGGVIAWIAISLPINFFIKLIVAIAAGGTGAMFAFVPIEGRPADLMLSYFFKALFKPNQYVFHKQTTVTFADMLYPATAVMQVPSPIPTTPPMRQNMQTTLPSAQYQTQFTQRAYPPQPILQPQQTTRPIAPIPQQPMTQPIGGQTHQLQQALSQKEQLEKQLAELQQQLATQKQQFIQQTQPQTQVVPQPMQAQSGNIPTTPIQSPIHSEQTTASLQSSPVKPVKPPPPRAVKPAQVSSAKTPMVSDFPNIVIGVVKDSRGNVLPNILVEVKDPDDNPVRAFKTNALGQFASATPLLNGTYTMLFEDPGKKHKFEPVQITAAGEVMQPIEITSVDDREELRKELFG